MFEFNTKIICPQDPTATYERVEQYKEYYKIKYEICKEINPKVIAEIGVRAGYSSWTFMQACPNATLYCFDANNGTHGGQGGQTGIFKNWAIKILSAYDMTYTDVDTQTIASLPHEKPIDFFHVDGDHTFHGVQNDLELAFNTLSENGVILIDDIDYVPDVKKGADIWLERKGLKAEYIKSLRGEYIIRK
jgi:predicted O-methyltransferase YrrM